MQDIHFMPLIALAWCVKLLHALARRAVKLLHRLMSNFWLLRILNLVLNGITSDIMDLGPRTSIVGPESPGKMIVA